MYGKFVFRETCSVYEIYPQNETPRLTQIAHLDFNPAATMTFLSPGTVIWCDCFSDRMVFRVWDYRLNHSISFIVEYLDYSVPDVYFILSKALKLALTHSLVGNRNEDSRHHPM